MADIRCPDQVMVKHMTMAADSTPSDRKARGLEAGKRFVSICTGAEINGKVNPKGYTLQEERSRRRPLQ